MRRGFTLVELLIVMAMAVVLLGALLPAASKSRTASRNVVSKQNMRTLGAAGMGYASDNEGKIYSLNPHSSNSSQHDAINILSRLTGRPIDGSAAGFVRLNSLMPNRRYNHFELMDYLEAQLPEPILASPFDRNLLEWQADPVQAQSTTVPYAAGSEDGYDRSSNWPNDDVRQLWPYGSTYQMVFAAWNPNNNMGERRSWEPEPRTPHLILRNGLSGQQRYVQQVAFPSKKVHLFEEFDRATRGDALWFAYPEARCNLLFFDGSVRRLPSRAANPGWNPARPNDVWIQRYMPLHTFPWYAPGHAEDEEMSMKYRWTREGLGGIDFGGKDIRVPEAALNDEN